MAEKRWALRAVMEYLSTFYHPRYSRKDVYRLIDSNVEDGTLKTWWRVRDGMPRLIDKSEWWRNPKKDGADAFGALEALQWRGLARLTVEDRATLEFEFEPSAVRRLCAPTRGRGERPDGRRRTRRRNARKPGPEGLRLLIEEAAQAVLPNGRTPPGMLKKKARTLMSDYLEKLGHGRPDPRTYLRNGH